MVVRGTSASVMHTMRRGILKPEIRSRNAVRSSSMVGTRVESQWRPGSDITWQGEWEGKRYRDKGKITALQRERRLQYTHFSPLSGLPDRPENYHTVTIELTPRHHSTRVTLTQDNNPSDEARKHSEKNWDTMLVALKRFVEKEARPTA